MPKRTYLVFAVLLIAACRGHNTEPQFAIPPASASHPYAGLWKDGHCDEAFGLLIAPAGQRLYSVSFCGPGGCFPPGAYRPDTAIVGDADYKVIDDNTLDVRSPNGKFQRYARCAAHQ
jgi:hypothetical protein